MKDENEEEFFKKYKFDEIAGKKPESFKPELGQMAVELKKVYKSVLESGDLKLKIDYTRAIALIEIAKSQKDIIDIKEKNHKEVMRELEWLNEPEPSGWGM